MHFCSSIFPFNNKICETDIASCYSPVEDGTSRRHSKLQDRPQLLRGCLPAVSTRSTESTRSISATSRKDEFCSWLCKIDVYTTTRHQLYSSSNFTTGTSEDPLLPICNCSLSSLSQPTILVNKDESAFPLK